MGACVVVVAIMLLCLSCRFGTAKEATRKESAQIGPAGSGTSTVSKIFQYRAVCPGCDRRCSRWCFFSRQKYHWRCRDCGCVYKVDPKWDNIGSSILALLIVGAMAIALPFSWKLSCVNFVVGIAFAFWGYPFTSPYIRVPDEATSQKGS